MIFDSYLIKVSLLHVGLQRNVLAGTTRMYMQSATAIKLANAHHYLSHHVYSFNIYLMRASKVYEVRFNCLPCKAHAERILESNQILRPSPLSIPAIYFMKVISSRRKFYAVALDHLLYIENKNLLKRRHIQSTRCRTGVMEDKVIGVQHHDLNWSVLSSYPKHTEN